MDALENETDGQSQATATWGWAHTDADGKGWCAFRMGLFFWIVWRAGEQEEEGRDGTLGV